LFPQVNLTPVSSTIAKLVAYATPQQNPDGSRIAPHEFTTATLKCTLKGFKMEKDSDYHLGTSNIFGDFLDP
jgi:hypothetical protein